jgi:hypothetical protein
MLHAHMYRWPPLACLLLATAAGAQDQVPQPKPLSSSEVRRVIEGAMDPLARYYVIPERADSAAAYVRQRMRAGAYDRLSTPRQLVDTLTADLQRITRDLHLRLVFSDAPASRVDETQAQREAADRAYLEMVRAEGRSRHFGFDGVTRLPGNIGLVRLSTFFPRDMSLATADGAMAMVANTDAVIIDLRYNTGGDPAMVGWLAGQFTDSVRFTGITTYNRVTNRTDSSFIRPSPGHQRFTGKPVYIVTSAEIFSAGEAFAVTLRSIGRAVVVGERTRGGAHLTSAFRIDDHFQLRVPHSRPTPDWDGIGVTPDIAATAAQAVKRAQLAALEQLAHGVGVHPDLREERQRVRELLRRELATSPP